MPSYGMMPGQTMMGGMNPAMAAMNMGAGPRGPGGQAGPGAVAKVDVPAGFQVVEPEESKNGRRRPPPQVR